MQRLGIRTGNLARDPADRMVDEADEVEVWPVLVAHARTLSAMPA